MNQNVTCKFTPLGNKGIFAKKNFSEGDVIATFTGTIIMLEEVDKLYEQGQDHTIQIAEGFFMLIDSDLKYTRHSCDANSAFLSPTKLTAIRSIKKGEEITFDYSLNENTSFKINCTCKSNNCRKVIGPLSDLPDEFVSQNRGNISFHLKKTAYTFVKTDENGNGYLDIQDFKDLIDISKVDTYVIEQTPIDRLIGDPILIIKFFDKDGNQIK